MVASTFIVYDGKVYGVKVSEYCLENGYLDYQALAGIVGDCILNNIIRSETAKDWKNVAGYFKEAVYQDYIISEYGYRFLEEHTYELIFYNERLDLYIWGHYTLWYCLESCVD